MKQMLSFLHLMGKSNYHHIIRKRRQISGILIWIGTSFFSVGRVPLLHKRFDVVIIDEVAQAAEPDCWIALRKCKKVILVR